MIEEPFDTHPDTWATLTEASVALRLMRNRLKSGARRALKRGEHWVKKEDGKILINLACPALPWPKAHRSAAISLDAVPWNAEKKATTRPSSQGIPLGDWSKLCKWLADHDLCVFSNLLQNEQTPALQWTWGNLHGTDPSPSVVDAVLDALEHQFAASEHQLVALEHQLDVALDETSDEVLWGEDPPRRRPFWQRWFQPRIHPPF